MKKNNINIGLWISVILYIVCSVGGYLLWWTNVDKTYRFFAIALLFNGVIGIITYKIGIWYNNHYRWIQYQEEEMISVI